MFTSCYPRTVRAEVMEILHRPFVTAAQSMGAPQMWIVRHHLLPILAPTLLTIALVDFATVIIADPVQPLDFPWGAMVATGRADLTQASWVGFFPGTAITLTTSTVLILGESGSC